jgi:hypothetical protein
MSTRRATEGLNENPRAPREIEVPAPTAWPFILALGAALLFAGLVTTTSVSCLGALLSMAGCVGWFREVFPHEHEEVVRILPEDIRLVTPRRVVDRLPILPDQVRAWLPLHTYPVSAGVKGGLAGSVAMAILACAYGLLKVGSIWYPINLLAAVTYRESLRLVPAQLNSFHVDAFAIAFVLHGVVSIFVGMLYGAMLPMFPRRPVLLGGFIGPALWSGLLYAILGLLNPLLASHIDWFWFMASQVAFGIIAGLVVVRQPSFPTRENVSFALRAGIEAPGTMRTRDSGENR